MSKKKSPPKKNYNNKDILDLINAPRRAHIKKEKLAYDEFHDLEFQRLLRMDQLKKSLIKQSTHRYEFKNWVRCISYQYSNTPLSTRGSVKSIGGRFNIGEDISEASFTPFNALYLAEDAPTAYFEKFGIKNIDDQNSTLTTCFNKKENISVIHVNGVLNNVLDLDTRSALKGFVNVLKEVTFSKEILERKKIEKFGGKRTIQGIKELRESLYEEEWRLTPQVYDVPANCQIFGQIAYYAKIEAILFSSTKGENKCLAIFPQNLGPNSYIELSGPFPKTVEVPVLNINSFEKCL